MKEQHFNQIRPYEKDISMLEAAGEPSPLKRLNRVYKWNTKNIIPDDGFVIFKQREINTIKQMEHPIPNLHLIRADSIPNQVCKDNLTDLLRKPREIQGPKSGFGSKLPTHHPDHDKRFL